MKRRATAQKCYIYSRDLHHNMWPEGRYPVDLDHVLIEYQPPRLKPKKLSMEEYHQCFFHDISELIFICATELQVIVIHHNPGGTCLTETFFSNERAEQLNRLQDIEDLILRAYPR